MIKDDKSETCFLYVGRTKNNRLTKLYIGKGSPEDLICPLWREVSKTQLDGDSEQTVREAAKALAREHFASYDDLLTKSKLLKFKMNVSRGLQDGPLRWFVVDDPWAPTVSKAL